MLLAIHMVLGPAKMPRRAFLTITYLAFTAIAAQADVTPSTACDHGLNSPLQVKSAGWGSDLNQSRYLPRNQAGINAKDLAALELKWSFAFKDASHARSIPAVTDQALILGSQEGSVFALDRESGCSFWRYQAEDEVRTGFSFATVVDRKLVFFGDLQGNAYGIDAATGKEVWKRRVDDHPHARITGTPSLYRGVLYVPVSSIEVARAINPLYNCCTFRGSVHALDVATGETIWKTYTIAEPALKTGRNLLLVRRYGPSGAAVWSAPAIDVQRGVLYVGTGQNYSSPADGNSDSIIAMDLQSGEIIWRRQLREDDAWNASCVAGIVGLNCPKEDGPDFDFGAPPILLRNIQGQDLIIAGQKSGTVFALRAEDGEPVWSTRVGKGGILGGIHWGMAADEAAIYVPINDLGFRGQVVPDGRPSIARLDASNGEIVWHTLINADCDDKDCITGLSAAVTLIEGAVVAPALDGTIRAYAIDSGEEIWRYDTTGEHRTVNGVDGKGGSLDAAGAVIADGLLLINSGYAGLSLAGNTFLVLAPGTPPTSGAPGR